MDIPAVTREYTPGSCRNARKPMRLSPRREMRPNYPALCPEQLRFPNQTRNESRFAWLKSRESPTTLSQDEKNTDVTPGMPNCSVYPKSNWDEANFPFIGSIFIPRSTSYKTSCLTPFRNLETFPETTVSSIEDHQFQYSFLRNVTCTPYHLRMRMIPVFDWRVMPIFHKHLNSSLPSEISMWEGLSVFCLKWMDPEIQWLQRRLRFPAVA